MPTLKQISCSIEIGTSNAKLKEYGTRYSDGHVETFIAVPRADICFTVHLRSEGYIAPGLAFFTFMDGQYQCNRNRVCLKLPGEGVTPSAYETEFRLRQKEEKTGSGSFTVREWTFAKLDRGETHGKAVQSRELTFISGCRQGSESQSTIHEQCRHDRDHRFEMQGRIRRSTSEKIKSDQGQNQADCSS